MLKLRDFDKIEELQTPFWYYDLDLLRRTADEVAKLSQKYGIGVHYALKANIEPRILQIISGKGFGADCVSGNEVIYAMEHGFRPETVVFAGVGKTDREISRAIDLGIGCFHVESLMELEVIDAIASAKGVRVNAAVRINPNIDAHTHKYVTTGLEENKFGISRHEFDSVIELLKSCKAVDFSGLHFHVGSQVLDIREVYSEECRRASEIVDYFERHGLVVRDIDLGGGLGVNYTDPDREPIPDFETWFSTINDNLKRRPGQTVSIEPGRSMVAQCGSLISRVVFVKHGEHKSFLILDAGMNDLIRPALYGSYHHIENLTAEAQAGSDSCFQTTSELGVQCEPVMKDNLRSHPSVMEVEEGRDVCCQTASGLGVQCEPVMKDNLRSRPSVMEVEEGVCYRYDVTGPVCESSDVWGTDRQLPESHRGDMLAIRSAGAYGSVMSSRYNLRDIAPAVFSDELVSVPSPLY